MIGKLFKGMVVLVGWLFVVIGVAAILPDNAWDTFPRKLYPLRTFLAQNKIISSVYLHQKMAFIPDKNPIRESLPKLENLTPSGTVASHDTLPSKFVPVQTDSVTNTKSDVKSDTKSAEIPVSSDRTPQNKDNKKEEIGNGYAETSDTGTPDTLPDLQFDNIANIAKSHQIEPALPSEKKIPLPVNPLPVNRDNSTVPGNASTIIQGPVPLPSSRPTGINAELNSVQASPDQTQQGSIIPTGAVIPSDSNVNNTLPKMGPLPFTVPSNEQPASPDPQLKNALDIFKTINKQTDRETISALFFNLNEILQQKRSQLTENERQQLYNALDKLAYTVFYDAQQHILESGYRTENNETLNSIAAKYQVTPEFLGTVNMLQISPTDVLPPGLTLKVVHGPVSGLLSMDRKEMTLLFNGFYAGRFKMGYSVPAKTQRGFLVVTQKIRNPEYTGPGSDGSPQTIPGGSPNNPLGPCWIELNNGLGLQGTNQPEYIGTEIAPVGGIIFSNRDIAHLDILLPVGAKLNLE